MSSENQEVATTENVEQAPALSGDPLNNTPETNTDWRAALSDELRADKSLENIKDVPSLAKSYIHAQKLVGADKIPVPNKHATEDDWNAVYSKLGRPETADGYKFNLPENQKVDEEGLKVFADHAHKLGLLPNQAEGMVKFYNEMQANQLATADSTAAAGRQKAIDELTAEWGQAYDQKLERANNVVREVFPKGFMSMNLEDGTKLGDHPAVIKAFATLADKMGEDKMPKAEGPTYLTPRQIDKEIATLQQPGSAYWDKNHPNHSIAVEEVQELFKQKHGVEE